MNLFRLRGSLSRGQAVVLGLVGVVLFLLLWRLLAEVFAVDVNHESQRPAEERSGEVAPAVAEGFRLIDIDTRPDAVQENAPVGTEVGLQVQPADGGRGEVYYQLTDNVSGIFAIHPQNGRVTVVDSSRLDCELATTQRIVVAASTADGRRASQSFTIQVEDVNEFPIGELTDVDPAENAVPQDAEAQSPVGITAFAEDPDAGDRVAYSLVSEPAGLLGIDPATGVVYVKDAEALQTQAGDRLSLQVVARSEDGSRSEADFRLKIVAPTAGGKGAGGSEKAYPILPKPSQVVRSYPSLVVDDDLASNTWRSIWINLQGYFWAVLLSVPLGFMIGLFPIFRGLFSKQVDALRYLPLTALTGLFIIWFGIEDQMKIAFLAFGIIVYLLPVVVQRIHEVEEVFTQTAFTLGANSWQTIRSVFFPSVMSKLMDDIRVLTAISWTYIIIAELLNREGGVGSLIYIKARQGQIPKVFAILIVIVLIGFLQDRIFVYLDKRLFPHKYYKTTLAGIREVEYGILAILLMIAVVIFQQIWLPSLTGTFNNLAIITVIAALIIIVFGEIKVRGALRKAG